VCNHHSRWWCMHHMKGQVSVCQLRPRIETGVAVAAVRVPTWLSRSCGDVGDTSRTHGRIPNCRSRWRICVASDFNHDEIALCRSAHRALPVVGDVLPAGPWLDALGWRPQLLVVCPAADQTHPDLCCGCLASVRHWSASASCWSTARWMSAHPPSAHTHGFGGWLAGAARRVPPSLGIETDRRMVPGVDARLCVVSAIAVLNPLSRPA
jgi:hypothetical protein